jgi:hemoglobin
VTGPGQARPTPEQIFASMGGEQTFRDLVERFYDGVADDPVLRPMYPEEDLGPARHRLTMFLIQYWGGEQRYALERGHPRLRMRHAGFSIGEAERDAWLRHMADALATLDLADAPRAQLWQYLTNAADALRNADH